MYYGLSVPQYVEATGGCESCDLKATNKITESQTFYEFDNLEISIIGDRYNKIKGLVWNWATWWCFKALPCICSSF